MPGNERASSAADLSVPAPLATTLNVAVWPTATVLPAGWVVIVGAAIVDPEVHTTPPG